MMGFAKVRDKRDSATRKARRERKAPVQGAQNIPFVGDYVPRGFLRITAPVQARSMACADGYLFVDSSGFGGSGEGALTQSEFIAYAESHPDLYFGAVEAGQFQVVVATYKKVSK